MLIQTQSYLVPADVRGDHARLLRQIRVCMRRLGGTIEFYEEEVGGRGRGRFVHLMRFRDRGHLQAVRHAEEDDDKAQRLIRRLSELVDLPRQVETGTFTHSLLGECGPCHVDEAEVTRAAVEAETVAAAGAPAEISADLPSLPDAPAKPAKRPRHAPISAVAVGA